MKKFLTVILLASAAFAQTSAGAQQPAGTQQSASDQKTIKDPAEYNAYMAATQVQDPAQRAAALEQFAQQYPSSVAKPDALEAAMTAYQQAGNQQKALETANTILQADSTNTSAAAIVVYTKRMQILGGQVPAAQAQQALDQIGSTAQQALNAMASKTKPASVSQADWDKRQQVFSTIFNGAIGHDALSKKDYKSAQEALGKAVQANPNDANDVYLLALAYLTEKPDNPQSNLQGIWYIARAANLANMAPAVVNYGKSAYTKYHGTADGWDQVLATAKTSPTPPAGYLEGITHYVPPSPEQQAHDLLMNPPANGDPLKMESGFAGWIFILQNGSPEDVQTVWNALQGKNLAFQCVIISGTADDLMVAVTEDGIAAKVPEVEVKMAIPLDAAPQPGQSIQLQGVPSSWTPKPFQIVMDKGAEYGKKPAAKKPAAKKRPATRKRH